CRGGIGVLREEHERVRPLRVRRVDAGGGADKAVPRLGDHERRTRPHDLTRLAENHLHAPGIAAARELARAVGRLGPGELDDTPFHLRDRLLGDDEDIAGLETTHGSGRLDEERSEVVSLLELRKATERDNTELVAQPRPVTWMPAWPL